MLSVDDTLSRETTKPPAPEDALYFTTASMEMKQYKEERERRKKACAPKKTDVKIIEVKVPTESEFLKMTSSQRTHLMKQIKKRNAQLLALREAASAPPVDEVSSEPTSEEAH